MRRLVFVLDRHGRGGDRSHDRPSRAGLSSAENRRAAAGRRHAPSLLLVDANVVAGTGIVVRPVLPGEVDAGDYQPRARGHPEARRPRRDRRQRRRPRRLHRRHDQGVGQHPKLHVIRPNEGVPLLKAVHGGAVNSHTFISFSNAIQQTYASPRRSPRSAPTLAAKLADQRGAYARRCARSRQSRRPPGRRPSESRGDRARRLQLPDAGVRDRRRRRGRAGARAGAVRQGARRHGRPPEARERSRSCSARRASPSRCSPCCARKAARTVYVISHIASGEYTADKFEARCSGTSTRWCRRWSPIRHGDASAVLEIRDLSVARDGRRLISRLARRRAGDASTV